MATKKPAPVGHIDITLSRPIELGGVSVSSVRMREPTVGDHLAAQALKGTDAEMEILLIANLCMLTVADIHVLPIRDFHKMQVAMQGFLD
jgi:hypothetical protein